MKRSTSSGIIKSILNRDIVSSWLKVIVVMLVGWFWVKPVYADDLFNKIIIDPIFIVFLIIFLFVFFLAVFKTIRLLLFGNPVLKLYSTPVYLGETLSGSIIINENKIKSKTLLATLECLHRTTNTGVSKMTTENMLWSNEIKLDVLSNGAIKFIIKIPNNQPETMSVIELTKNLSIIWRLTFNNKTTYKYEIPVKKRISSN